MTNGTAEQARVLLDRMVNPNLPQDLIAIAIALQVEGELALKAAPDDPDTLFGIMNLMQAKDCFIRARVAQT